jgi:transcriptional regulator with XRE-family HTH domain
MGRRSAGDLRSVVAKQLRTLRHARNLTQLALIERSEDALSQTALSQYETGQAMPSIGMLEVLAKALDVEAAALLLDPSASERQRLAAFVLTCSDEDLQHTRSAIHEFSRP